jgi:hypothetical protein
MRKKEVKQHAVPHSAVNPPPTQCHISGIRNWYPSGAGSTMIRNPATVNMHLRWLRAYDDEDKVKQHAGVHCTDLPSATERYISGIRKRWPTKPGSNMIRDTAHMLGSIRS